MSRSDVFTREPHTEIGAPHRYYIAHNGEPIITGIPDPTLAALMLTNLLEVHPSDADEFEARRARMQYRLWETDL